MADSVHRLAGSSGQEKGGLVIMKKKNKDEEGMPPPKKSMLGQLQSFSNSKLLSD